jgi:hypothetical protein
MKPESNRKLKFAYFSAILITLGFAATGFFVPLQPSFGLFVGAIGALAALLFGANVGQKIGLKDTYIKELEIKNNKGDDT